MRRSNRTLTTCLLGLVSLALSAACGLPADPQEGPQWELDPVETATAEPWTPSEQWLELYAWDQRIQDLRAAGEMDQYHQEHREFEDWIIQNPDADIPCQAMQRYGPREMRDSCIDPET